MALTGTLRDFGIAEILQLIGTQKKTGSLSLEDGKRRAEIQFADGMVVGATGGEETPTFEERLVKSGLLTREQLDIVQKHVHETLKPLPSVLITDNILDSQKVRELVIRQYSEIVYEVFNWKSGTYAFSQKFLQWDKQFVTPIPAESIMMEGLRIVDEGPGVRKVIPRLDDVFARVERTPDEFEGIDRETMAILKLVDGKSTIKEVILRSDQDRFDALKKLAWLRSNRYISLSKEKADAGDKEDEGPVELSPVARIALFLLLAVTVGSLLFKVGQTLYIYAAPLSSYASSNSPAPEMLGKARVERVQGALEVYRLRNGRYPNSLKTLEKQRLIHPGDIRPLGGKPLKYTALNSGASYALGAEAEIAIEKVDASKSDIK